MSFGIKKSLCIGGRIKNISPSSIEAIFWTWRCFLIAALFLTYSVSRNWIKNPQNSGRKRKITEKNVEQVIIRKLTLLVTSRFRQTVDSELAIFFLIHWPLTKTLFLQLFLKKKKTKPWAVSDVFAMRISLWLNSHRCDNPLFSCQGLLWLGSIPLFLTGAEVIWESRPKLQSPPSAAKSKRSLLWVDLANSCEPYRCDLLAVFTFSSYETCEDVIRNWWFWCEVL